MLGIHVYLHTSQNNVLQLQKMRFGNFSVLSFLCCFSGDLSSLPCCLVAVLVLRWVLHYAARCYDSFYVLFAAYKRFRALSEKIQPMKAIKTGFMGRCGFCAYVGSAVMENKTFPRKIMVFSENTIRCTLTDTLFLLAWLLDWQDSVAEAKLKCHVLF